MSRQEKFTTPLTKIARVDRLEQKLIMIEDQFFLMGILIEATRRENPAFFATVPPTPELLLHPELIRKKLFTAGQQERASIMYFGDVYDFLEKWYAVTMNSPGVSDQALNEDFVLLASLLGIGNWATESRRVWHLQEDLELSFLATSFGNLEWKDIKFPFKSFGISLDVPIKSDDGKTEFDFLLVNVLDEGERGHMLNITPLPKELAGYRRISKLKRQMIRGPLNNKKYESAVRQVDKYTKEHMNGVPYGFITEPLNNPKKLTEILKEDTNRDRVVKLVLGTILHLGQTGMKFEQRTRAHERHQSSDSIASKAEVFDVFHRRLLTPELREVFRRALIDREPGYEVRAHFRRGYWHRPRGTGMNPNQEKTEWTEPTIVRADKLSPGELPSGSEVELGSKKH